MCRVTQISIKEASTKQRQSVPEHDYGQGKISFLSEEALKAMMVMPELGLCMKRFKGDLQTEGLVYSDLSVGDTLIIREIEVNVTQVGKPCHAEACVVFDKSKPCIMTKGTMFGMVNEPGKVCVGDLIKLENAKDFP